MRFGFFLIFLLASVARADDFIDWLSDPQSPPTDFREPSRRENLFTLTGEYGDSGRFGGGLSAGLGLDRDWQLLGGASFTQLDPRERVVDGRLGASYLRAGQFELSAVGTMSFGPQGNRAYGGLLDGMWWLSSLWESTRATLLRTSVGYTHYDVPVAGALPRDEFVNSFYFALAVTQEIFAGFYLEGGYGRYTYDLTAARLERGVSERTFPGSSFGVVTQFPEQEWRLSARWNVLDSVSLGVGGFAVQTYAPKSTILGLAPYVELGLSSSVFLTVRATASRSSGSTSYLFTTFLDFYWD
jgi:hypothetical protein